VIRIEANGSGRALSAETPAFEVVSGQIAAASLTLPLAAGA